MCRLYSALTPRSGATLAAMTSGWFAAGALLAGTGVALGAFGAHGLKSKVTAELLAVFEVGVRYQIYHALALMAVAWATTRWPGAWVSSHYPKRSLRWPFVCPGTRSPGLVS